MTSTSLDRSAGAEDATTSAPASSLIVFVLGIVRLGMEIKGKRRESNSINTRLFDKKLRYIKKRS